MLVVNCDKTKVDQCTPVTKIVRTKINVMYLICDLTNMQQFSKSLQQFAENCTIKTVTDHK